MHLSKFILSKRNYGFMKIFRKPDFGKYSVVVPGNVSEMRSVPKFIKKPIYYETGQPEMSPKSLEIKNETQIQFLKNSCTLAANILKEIGNQLKIGMTTDKIDELVHNSIIEKGAYPSPLNYKYFPKSVCTSVNNVACHGIPDDRPLEDGDIINVDITVFLDGFHGDCSKTFLVGNVDEKGKALVKATQNCLHAGIEICKPGTRFGEIGRIIEIKAKEQGFVVLPSFCGHGIGTYFHGQPEIMHVANSYPGQMLPGMAFTIEPVVGQGTTEIEILEDEWTCITLDGSRTAQFEHTVLITDNGVEILTVPDC